MIFYNTERPHSALLRRTPQEAYWGSRDENRRHDNQPGYTLIQPPNCPENRDHFNIPPAEAEEQYYAKLEQAGMAV